MSEHELSLSMSLEIKRGGQLQRLDSLKPEELMGVFSAIASQLSAMAGVHANMLVGAALHVANQQLATTAAPPPKSKPNGVLVPTIAEVNRIKRI